MKTTPVQKRLTHQCPVCKSDTLTTGAIEQGLPSQNCHGCGGSWVEAEAYLQWRESGDAADPVKDVQVNLSSGEAAGLKFCPQCSHIMVKYKVGHDVTFSIDHCGACGGIWFDKNEWQILKAHELHGHVHQVFSQEWQSGVRAKEHEQAMHQILRERLGEADFNELQRVRDWLDHHPKSDELYALLFGSRVRGS